MKRKLTAAMVAAAIIGIANAQENATDTSVVQDANNNIQSLSVPAPRPGQCQALVIVPAKFEPETQQIEIKEAAKTYEIVPAEYEWTEEQVEVKPATEELKVIPATYKTEVKEIEVEPKTVEKTVIPPKYTEVNDEVTARPSYLTAQSQGPARTFQSVGEALRLVEVPEQKEAIKKQVVQEQARVDNKEVEGKIERVEVQVVDEPARVEKVPVEAEYKTVRVKKLVKDAQEVEKEIPAEYAEVKTFKKVADAQMRWEEVLCESEVNADTIKSVQSALNSKGYNAGTPDGALGPTTMRALEKFQRDNNLATGGVTMETMRALGVL